MRARTVILGTGATVAFIPDGAIMEASHNCCLSI